MNDAWFALSDVRRGGPGPPIEGKKAINDEMGIADKAPVGTSPPDKTNACHTLSAIIREIRQGDRGPVVKRRAGASSREVRVEPEEKKRNATTSTKTARIGRLRGGLAEAGLAVVRPAQNGWEGAAARSSE